MIANHPRRSSVDELFNYCEPNWTVSINLKGDRLDFLLRNGVSYNRFRMDHSLKKQVYKKSYVPDESPIDWDAYESELGEWGPRRRVFNEFAESEEEFTYGAYYVRGTGIFSENYGRYLILLRREWLAHSSKTSFLLADSLQGYTRMQDKRPTTVCFEEDRLKADLAHAGTVTKLVCLKKADELGTVSVSACIDTICCPEEYVEAQIAEEIGHAQISKVMVPYLTPEEADLHVELLGATNSLKPEEMSNGNQKNVYYYTLFTADFPRIGVQVEFF